MTEQDYKKILKDSVIKYRSYLDLPVDVSFGVEIEYENVVKDTISYLLETERETTSNLNGWINKNELSISTYNSSKEEMNGEINSPILVDAPKNWMALRNVLDLLNKKGALITQSCGGHVNIGSHILENKNEYWRNFFLLWILYEKEIYKFSSGEFKKLRTDINFIFQKVTDSFDVDKILNIENENYLYSVNYELFDKVHDIYISKKTPDKNIKLNNRIEFRIPNGSLSEEIWQNYINFFARFLLACKKELDVEKVVYKIKDNDHSAVELVDYIFDSELDKEYFLIQALKTNKVYKKELPEHKFF